MAAQLRRAGGGFGRVSGAATGQEAVEEQEDRCSDDGYNEAAQVEPEELWPVGQELVEEAPDEGTGDAEQHRDDAAAWIPSGGE